MTKEKLEDILWKVANNEIMVDVALAAVDAYTQSQFQQANVSSTLELNRLLLLDSKYRLWIKKGLYYGYPQCCIVDFCRRGYRLTKEQRSVHDNTGFTPCPECSKKILKGEVTLDGLLINRACKTKFPIDDMD